TRHLRLQTRQASKREVAGEPCEEGVQLSIIVSEVEPVGNFIGISCSEPLLHGGILLSVFGYMLFLQPMMALVSLAVFLPQIFFVGGWFVVEGRTEVGTVVAFISGLDRVNDPWGDLVNYFRDMTSSRVKYRLVERALNGTSPTGEIAPAS